MLVKRIVVIFLLTFILSGQVVADKALKSITATAILYSADFSADGKIFYSRGDNLSIYNAKNYKLIKRIPKFAYAVNIKFNYYITAAKNQALELRDIKTRKVIKTFMGFSDRGSSTKSISDDARTRSAVLTPDAKYLIACSKTKFMVRIWNVKTGKLIKELDFSFYGASKYDTSEISLSSGGKYFSVVAYKGNVNGNGHIYLIETRTGVIKNKFPIRLEVTSYALGYKGNKVVKGDILNNILLVAFEKNKQILKFKDKGIRAIAMSRNGKYIASVSNKENIKLWNAKTGKQLKLYDDHNTIIMSVNFSPDGRLLISTDLDDVIKIWNVQKRKGPLKDTRQKGIVHKASNYWKQFKDFSVAEKIFKGEFSNLAYSNNMFKLYYIYMQSEYYGFCREKLPANSIRRASVSQVQARDGAGNIIRREKAVEHIAYIAPQFIKKYDAFFKRAKSFKARRAMKKHMNIMKDIQENIGKNGQSILGASVQVAMEGVSSEPILPVINFFKQTPCDSATMYQMRENFRRAAYNKPSLQQAGIKIPNAKKESISFKDFLNERTIYQACINANIEKFYCKCFNKKVDKVMTKKELDYYSKDFSRFDKEVVNDIWSKPKNHRAWKLIELRNQCLR